MVNTCLSFEFPAVSGKNVMVNFDGDDLSSDGGLLLVAHAERRLGLIETLSKALSDRRQASKVPHEIPTILRERIYAIACGYEDANDLDRLREEPVLKIACQKRPGLTGVLASQPTISRLENLASNRELYQMGKALAKSVIAQLPRDTKEIILDVDATDDPCHGQQEFNFFNTHYDDHCFLPLLIYITGSDNCQRLLASLLRPGNASYRVGLFGLLRQSIRLIRTRFPDVRIILRADGGFGNADVLSFCERQRLDYVLGLPTNSRLAVLSTPVQMDTALKYALEGDGCREYAEFEYKAGSWPHCRRVIVKVEVTQHKLNPRYVVTNLSLEKEDVHRFYCERGDRENRIKELKVDIFSGRTSCHRFQANQFRLLPHTAAYVLMSVLRVAAQGTAWADAQAGTLRVRLLKVAVRVVETYRKIWLHLPTAFPAGNAWATIYQRLLEPDR